MDRPPHTRRRPRIRNGTGGERAPRLAFLALLLALLVCAPGCAALESSITQLPTEGPLVVSFIDLQSLPPEGAEADPAPPSPQDAP